ncbi:MAG: hypothetical protein K0R66_908 [Gammaproteobacteria bacterium]|jgi:hypothetical protein|nr:hypothetical protein [Gammaproteobacteria bacterium]
MYNAWRRVAQAARSAKGLESTIAARGISFNSMKVVRDGMERPVLSVMEAGCDWPPHEESRPHYILDSMEQLRSALRASFPGALKLLVFKVNQTVLDSGSDSKAKPESEFKPKTQPHRPYPGHISTFVIDLSSPYLIVAGTLMSKVGHDTDGGLAKREIEEISTREGKKSAFSNYKVTADFHKEKDFLENGGLITADINPLSGPFLKQASKEYFVAMPIAMLSDVPVANLFNIWQNCGIVPKEVTLLPMAKIFEESGIKVSASDTSLSYEDFMKASVHVFQNGIKNEDGSYLVKPRAVYNLLKDACTQAVAAVHGLKIGSNSSAQTTLGEVIADLMGKGAFSFGVTESISNAMKAITINAFDLGDGLKEAPTPSTSYSPDQ